jgi:hypothetical protein
LNTAARLYLRQDTDVADRRYAAHRGRVLGFVARGAVVFDSFLSIFLFLNPRTTESLPP